MMKQSVFPLLTGALVFFGSLNPAQASPLFSVGAEGDESWADCIASGKCQAVTGGLTDAANQFYSQQVMDDPGLNSFQLVPSTLFPEIEDGMGGTLPEMAMVWDNDSPSDTLNVAAWEYVYDQDPDLTNTTIHVSLTAPAGIWDLSLELIDANNNSRGWFQVGPSSGTFWIRPDVAAAQAPFTSFVDSPLFDITQVVAIRLDEASMGGVPFAAPPVGGTVPVMPGWNVWGTVQVQAVPEPLTILGSATAAGFGAFFKRELNKKKKKDSDKA